MSLLNFDEPTLPQFGNELKTNEAACKRLGEIENLISANGQINPLMIAKVLVCYEMEIHRLRGTVGDDDRLEDVEFDDDGVEDASLVEQLSEQVDELMKKVKGSA